MNLADLFPRRPGVRARADRERDLERLQLQLLQRDLRIAELVATVKLLQEALALADQRFLERRMHRWRG